MQDFYVSLMIMHMSSSENAMVFHYSWSVLEHCAGFLATSDSFKRFLIWHDVQLASF